MSEIFTVWNLIRVSGILAFYFMSLSLAFGLLCSFSKMKKKKAFLLSVHQTSGWYGFLTIVFHLLLIFQDQYINYSLAELLIPFVAKNEPIYSGLGTLSFYLFFFVLLSSDFFIKKLGVKNWRKLHLAVIPAWILMLIHGITIGTDSSESWAIFVYFITCTFILVLLFMKVIDSVINRPTTNKYKRQL